MDISILGLLNESRGEAVYGGPVGKHDVRSRIGISFSKMPTTCMGSKGGKVLSRSKVYYSGSAQTSRSAENLFGYMPLGRTGIFACHRRQFPLVDESALMHVRADEHFPKDAGCFAAALEALGEGLCPVREIAER
ncbi:hypothetical protein BN2475_510051 [Paraburkholderia ribeironis]|uniref:Uncharacterized protein n=1 Tax=Paraburkholderia ribeironis TaxID=1247936 RepID=A0A1N7SCB9_9BURK|nr:hypothetical protein [Paraburkholderia ribeironis]SIT44982.1 hypothetical protein BN2475_510051 [Paraburkholderia ribeironis]